MNTPGVRHATPGEIEAHLASEPDALVLDVRTPEEYHGETGHLGGALLLPVQELAERIGELAAYRDRTVLVYCRSGVRSVAATRLLAAQGFRAINMSDGILRWIAERRPVVHEELP
jgi:rhodanese-related sulfurtransferase